MGSLPGVAKRIGIVDVAAFAANAGAGPPLRGNHVDVATDQIDRQRREPASYVVGPSVFNPNVLIFDKPASSQTFMKSRQTRAECLP